MKPPSHNPGDNGLLGKPGLANRLLQHIIDPEIRGGVPVLKGTGFTVAQALTELAEAAGVPEFADEFDLDPEVVKAMLVGLSLIFQRPCGEVVAPTEPGGFPHRRMGRGRRQRGTQPKRHKVWRLTAVDSHIFLSPR